MSFIKLSTIFKKKKKNVNKVHPIDDPDKIEPLNNQLQIHQVDSRQSSMQLEQEQQLTKQMRKTAAAKLNTRSASTDKYKLLQRMQSIKMMHEKQDEETKSII